MKLIAILLSVLVPSVGWSDEGAVYLPKGNAAPFSGFLITEEKANKIRQKDLDLELANKSLEIKIKEIELFEGRISRANNEIDRLSKKDGFFTKVGFFILGAAVTTVVAYGASQAVK
jgi:hypothetical protein